LKDAILGLLGNGFGGRGIIDDNRDGGGRKLQMVTQNPQGYWSFTRIPVIFGRAPPVATLHAPKHTITIRSTKAVLQHPMACARWPAEIAVNV
jgi:hypothetical protein